MDAAVELLHRVSRSSVTVAAEIPQSHPSAGVLGTARFGSGSVVDTHGLVLTVNYIVLGASKVRVVDIEGRRHAARVVAQDFATGVALLRADMTDVPPLMPGGSDRLAPGDDVCVVASAGDNERRTASGVVTAVDAFDAYWEYRLERALWLTCPNPGLGGGPVCNRLGQLTGVVSLNLGNVGRATLAIPAENFYEHAEELLEHGRRVSRAPRAWLGMFCYALADRTVVAGLVPGSPGDLAGLESGDLIMRVDAEPVESRAGLYETIWTHDPGEVVNVDVYREGQLLTLSVVSTDVEDFFS
ncbi:MAG: serine protease [Myxococcales bacterium]|nr:MAG: serine protease [Myxococcales bacterium]